MIPFEMGSRKREREAKWGKLMGLQKDPLAQKGKCEHTNILRNIKALHGGIHKKPLRGEQSELKTWAVVKKRAHRAFSQSRIEQLQSTELQADKWMPYEESSGSYKMYVINSECKMMCYAVSLFPLITGEKNLEVGRYEN